METLTKTNEFKSEKSFDVLASVKLYRYDLATVGYIRPETRQRVFEEELSYIAEGINLPLCTEFVLHQQAGQLVYFHKGQWRSYVGSLVNNLDIAKREAKTDPRRQFMAERAAEDLRIGYQISGLEPGERLLFKAEFPQAECDAYGEEFISEELAFQPSRKMGFLYEAEKTLDGRTILRSQSVDGNETDAYAAAMECGADGGSIDDMREAYDSTMQAKYGVEFFAGRRLHANVPEESAWEVVQANTDLIEYLLSEIDKIARQNLSVVEAETAKKRLTYGVWARLKERLDERSLGIRADEYSYTGGGSIAAQVESAYEAAAARGERLLGCGGSITGERAIQQASPKDVFNLIFGNQKKWFSCPYCGATQYGDPCSSNQFCAACTAKVENGRVISKGKGRKIKKGFLEILTDELTDWKRQYEAEQSVKKQRVKAMQEIEQDRKFKTPA